MLLLLVHITLAVSSLVVAAGVIIASSKRKVRQASTRLHTMWLGTLMTLASGVGLAVLSSSSLGSTCLSLFAFLAVVSGVHAYKVVAMPSRSSL
jgi:hypothetical protein